MKKRQIEPRAWPPEDIQGQSYQHQLGDPRKAAQIERYLERCEPAQDVKETAKALLSRKETSMMYVQPYLFFNGRCEEALNFYRTALDAEIEQIMRYKEAPPSSQPQPLPKGWDIKIIHAALRIGQTQILMSDGHGEQEKIQSVALSLAVDEEADAERYFNALKDGGKVQMPLTETFWSPRFGMLTDRFGLVWMVGVENAAGENGKGSG